MDTASFRGRKFAHSSFIQHLRATAGVQAVYNADEAYTSKFCCHCTAAAEATTPMLTPIVFPKDCRYGFCTKCRRGVDRDENGARKQQQQQQDKKRITLNAGMKKLWLIFPKSKKILVKILLV
uniref:Cas12f1-like TNB domain-containing protein n=1 Tax=Cacopsylla melanoneura TaxID=428564 RepID=A0A8D9EZ00_9HEMI